jgi:hypothetical protein
MDRQLNAVLADLDKTMIALRESMKGLPVRAAGFKDDHDALAKAISMLSVDLADSYGLLMN